MEEGKKEFLLEGEKVNLRLMTVEDTDLIVHWRNLEFVRKNFIFQEPFSREIHENWIHTMIETGKAVQFMICTKEDNKPIGSTYLRDIDYTHRKAEYGVFIGEENACTRGFGTETATLMLRYAFEALDLHKVTLRVLSENVIAQKSYEHAGFFREAYLREEVFLRGKYHDVILMAALNPIECDLSQVCIY